MKGGGDAPGAREEIPGSPGKDYGEVSSSPANHVDPQWSTYPPSAHEGLRSIAGVCLKKAV